MTNNAAAERAAFLESLRPLVADTPAAETLDAYIEELARLDAVVRLNPRKDYRAAPAEHRDPAAQHEWAPVSITLASDQLPKRARKTLLQSELFRCAVCSALSNCAYPYWYRRADGIWQMAKPPCSAPK